VQRILIVDDDEAMRSLLRARLSGTYEVLDVGDPEQALALALENKPDAIFLDLMMPKFSGFEICQTLRSLSYTSRIPIFVITGESGARYKEHCENLGATAFFEKPVDFAQLKNRLVIELQAQRPERRAYVRVRMHMLLRVRGIDASGGAFEELTTTENISAGGFLSVCRASLVKDSLVEVFLAKGTERYAGKARVIRQEAAGAPWQRYGFQFVEKCTDWPLQS
jgi:DNA-binding response OmpR family regulator